MTLIFQNSMCNRNFTDMDYFRKHFDFIVTCDIEDAQNLGMYFVEEIYSREARYVKEQTALQYDVVFVGTEKGRGKQLIDIYNHFSDMGLKCAFTVVGLKDGPAGIQTTPISYNEYLSLVSESKAMLEICAGTQNGLTLRAAEAVIYDKILITNSSWAEISPALAGKAYTFQTLEDVKKLKIDFDQEVHYNYTDAFSPLHLLTLISEKLGEKRSYQKNEEEI